MNDDQPRASGVATERSPNGVATVVIADRRPMVRQIVRMACDSEATLEVVGEASDGPSAVQTCLELQPAVLVLGSDKPDTEGVAVVAGLRRAECRSRVLAFGTQSGLRPVVTWMRAGVHGYIDNTADIDNLARAIATVGKGERVFAEGDASSGGTQLAELVKHARDRSHVGSLLSAREMEVLRLIAQGLTTRQMATRLHLSERTIESHISKLYKKVGASNRAQVIAKGRALGIEL